MNTIAFLLVLVHFVCYAIPSEAQKLFRIASLNTGEQFVSSFEGFKSRMAELGYKEGWNVRYSYYDAKGSDSVLNKFSRNIVEEKVDLIVTSSTTATVAAARATKGSNIPVLFLSAGNPEKFIKSFSSSGSNLAGISSATVEITGKKFELIRDIAPWVKRIATLQDPNGVNFEANLRESRNAAKILGFTLREFATGSREEIVNILPTITRQSADAIFTPPDSLITQLIDMIINQAIREKLPLITSLLANVKKGCLATYAADYSALGGQGAVLADKIFRGTKPADLPVELPKKWKLVLNMKTARAIGLNIPKEVLLRADEVFE